ncbi:MAG: hypothetical protein CYG61_08170 [Actinobacteria bacterium]|nr:MAG: hypothetical protein CYG61_08170 [Actinomycetota bacterium]
MVVVLGGRVVVVVLGDPGRVGMGPTCAPALSAPASTMVAAVKLAVTDNPTPVFTLTLRMPGG